MREASTDTVDAIVTQWSTQRPDLDFTPLSVFSRISRIDKHLDALRRRAFAAAGLDLAEFDVLSALRRAGEPFALSPKQLLETNLVSSGTMTNRIDRLARRGLVLREADPTDRRSVRVKLTPEGKVRADSAILALVNVEQQVLADIPEDELETFIAQLRALALRISDTSPAAAPTAAPPASTKQEF